MLSRGALRAALAAACRSPPAQARRSMAAMTAFSTDEVGFTTWSNAGVITLQRTKALNALTLGMVEAMRGQVGAWATDDAVKVVLVEGAGGKAFCAGGDVVAVAKSSRGEDGGVLAASFFRQEYLCDYKLATLDKPLVALIHGITMGGGVGLSINAPYRVATEKTLFAMPETAIGLFPDVSGSFFLPRLEGQLGMYLALSGSRLKGENVYKAGIATHFVNSEDLDALKGSLAECTSDDEVASVLDGAHAATDGPAVYEDKLDLINTVFVADSAPAIFARLEEAAASDEWAAKLLKTMSAMSPLSMCLTVEQLRRGASLSLEECFIMECRMAGHCMTGNDFYEGVRAVLIDKDHSPHWSHRTTAQVIDKEVEHYFDDPLDNDLTVEDLQA